MITGTITEDGEPVIALILIGSEGQREEITVIVDTGFNGFLTLPPDLIETLGLTWISKGQSLLGNGRIDDFDVYSAEIIWHGKKRRVMIEEADTEPLLGMALLFGNDLSIHATIEGTLTINSLETN